MEKESGVVADEEEERADAGEVEKEHKWVDDRQLPRHCQVRKSTQQMKITRKFSFSMSDVHCTDAPALWQRSCLFLWTDGELEGRPQKGGVRRAECEVVEGSDPVI